MFYWKTAHKFFLSMSYDTKKNTKNLSRHSIFVCLWVFVFTLYYNIFPPLGLCYRGHSISLAAYYLRYLYSSRMYSMKNIFYIFTLKEGQHHFHKLQEDYGAGSHCTRRLTCSFSYHVIKCLVVGRRAACFLRNAVKRKLIC